jgi:hypothetical protein
MPDRSWLLCPKGRSDGGILREAAAKDSRGVAGLAPERIGLMLSSFHRRKRSAECLMPFFEAEACLVFVFYSVGLDFDSVGLYSVFDAEIVFRAVFYQ